MIRPIIVATVVPLMGFRVARALAYIALGIAL
jgi:hypothetical protein